MGSDGSTSWPPPAQPRYRVAVSIHLVGGGRDEAEWPALYTPFVREATAQARSHGSAIPTIGIVVVHAPDEVSAGSEMIARFTAAVAGQVPADIRPLVVVEGGQLHSSSLTGLDAVLVAGGLTPAYAHALEPLATELAALVEAGTPYLGFSAGAAIAARRAVVGGYRQDGVVICPEDNAEDLDELTVVDGLGLVEFAVDVHAAQWGNVTRLMAAVEVGAVDRGVAVDENTLLLVPTDSTTHSRAGAGRLWWVSRQGPDIVVRLEAARP
jgi:cyanophycinase